MVVKSGPSLDSHLLFIRGVSNQADGSRHVVSGSDDQAAPFLDPTASQRIAPFGFPRIQWISNEQLWEHFEANPVQYLSNANAEYRSSVSGSKHAEEIISAAFFRGDVQFFERRLKLIGGVRTEQTNIEAEGPLTDPTRNFQRDARGAVILGANGRPVPITNLSQLTAGPAISTFFLNYQIKDTAKLDEATTVTTGLLADDICTDMLTAFQTYQA